MNDFLVNFFQSLYGITVLFSFIIALLCKEFKIPSVSVIGALLILFILTILFGFRTIETGTDTYAYYLWFKSLDADAYVYYSWFDMPKKQEVIRDFEPLFTTIGYCINWLTTNHTIFFATISVFTLYYVGKTSYTASGIIIVPLSLVISVSFISGVDLLTNGIRNGFALAISTYAILKYIEDRRHCKFITYISLASMIHASCIVFFIIFILNRIFNEKYLKTVFYVYIAVFLTENLKIFDFIFSSIEHSGIGNHITSRILAFKYQESEMFSGYIKYYFFAITLIPYLLYRFKYYVNKKIFVVHYVLLIPYAMIFSSPSSYRYSYISFYLMVIILAQSVMNTNTRIKKIAVYLMLLVMIIITYSTKTSMSYQNILFI